MADDTVEAARRTLLIEIDTCLERAFAQQGIGSGYIVEHLDALIAAVRAENDAKNVLTDAEVDAFLEAVEDEQASERVEHIRKLFLQKLDSGS